MKTKIKQFWNYFKKESPVILKNLKNRVPIDDKFDSLNNLLQNFHPKLQAFINRPPNGEVQLVFLTKGRLGLKIIVSEILNHAPENENWTFKSGLPPWEGSLEQCYSHYQFLGSDVHIYGVYFDIAKIYPKGKLNLIVHVQKNKPLPKNFINDRIRIFLLFYLGDLLYYKKIAYIKIAQKKYRKINFLPIHKLKRLLEFSEVK